MPGKAEVTTSAFFLSRLDPSPEEGHARMFVVMAANATEGEINAVKSHILAEGLTPYDHVGHRARGHRRGRRDRRRASRSS